ncbi:MAG: hypothetical protein GXP42_02645 [Chloroflexi bacterium]|nr:hypothetical protein [Chloroflexota bacterium]
MSERSTSAPKKEYVRFGLSDRIAHFLVMVSFTMLVITGIPQKYVPANWAEVMVLWMGGIERVRIVHRIAALVLIAASIYHVLVAGYNLYVRRAPLSMLPKWKDVTDAFETIQHYLGLREEPPKYDRYNFAEKLEYWAMVWGTLIMAVTGFMLWNPITTTKFLPGEFIPAALAAHGGEALLAFLSILAWHVYNVHLRTFNRSMFTGKLTREEMEEEHWLELERIEKGETPPLIPDPRRRMIYIPLAVAFTLISLFLLYLFVTYEETAIATVPPQPVEVEIYTPATPTPTPKPDLVHIFYERKVEARPVTHDIVAERRDCLFCHGLGRLDPYSPIHAELGLNNASCLDCHAPEKK